MKKILILLFLACMLLLPRSGFAGNPFHLADSLFFRGNYYAAALEYERAVFLSASGEEKTRALLSKAKCFKQTGSFKEALRTAERVNYAGLPDSLAALCRYETALCAYLAGDFITGENHLLQLHAFIKDSSLIRLSFPLYALTLNESMKWEEAKEKLLAAIEFSGMSATEKAALRAEAEELYTPGNRPKLKNPLKAQKLSAFLPGSGQMYAGYFWEGAAGSLLNLAGAGLIGWLAWTELYFTAVSVGSTVFTRFYLGGQNRAQYLAEKNNYKKLREYNGKLKPIILKMQEK